MSAPANRSAPAGLLVELQRYSSLLRRWAWLVVLAASVSGGVAYGVSLRQHKLYRSTAMLIINQGQSPVGPTFQDVQASQQLAATYAKMAMSWPMLSAAAKSLGLSGAAVQASCSCLVAGRTVLIRFETSVPLGTQLLAIDAVSDSPARAASGADAVAQAFADAIRQSQLNDTSTAQADLSKQIQTIQASIERTASQLHSLSTQPRLADGPSPVELGSLQGQLAQEQATDAALQGQLAQILLAQSRASNSVKLVAPAQVPLAPFSPRTRLNTLLATLCGCLLGSLFVVALDYLDDRVRSPADVERVAPGVSTLGRIERAEAHAAGSATAGVRLSPSGRASALLEAYRHLRSNLEFAAAGRSAQTIVVTSGLAAEGKTTTSANLAIVLAQAGRRVLLVDADLRRPDIHRLFGLPNSAGFSTLFLMRVPDLGALAHDSDYQHLQVLTSGPTPPNPTELFASAKMPQVMAALTQAADVVIFDSSPLLAVADAAELAARSDGVVLVVDATSTRSIQVTRAKAALDRASAALLGVVLNKLSRDSLRQDYYETYPYQKDGLGKAEGGGRPDATWRERRSTRARSGLAHVGPREHRRLPDES